MTLTFQIFRNKKYLTKYLIDEKLKMSGFFIFEIKRAKMDKMFILLKGCLSVISIPMDMIFDVFSETDVRPLKHIISQFFSKYSKNHFKVLKMQQPLTKMRTVMRPSNYKYLIELYKGFLKWP